MHVILPNNVLIIKDGTIITSEKISIWQFEAGKPVETKPMYYILLKLYVTHDPIKNVGR